MAMQDELNQQLKTAMRNKDKKMLNLVRMLKTKMTETTTAAGFSGEVDDALWLKVIEAYAKSQKKALTTYENIEGDGAKEHVENIQWDLNALEQWLPKKADEDTVRGWVNEAITGLGGAADVQIGRVIGAVMKAHKNEADPAMVRAVAAEILN